MSKREFFKNYVLVNISDFQEMQKAKKISEKAYKTLFSMSLSFAFNGAFYLVDVTKTESTPYLKIGTYDDLNNFLEVIA